MSSDSETFAIDGYTNRQFTEATLPSPAALVLGGTRIGTVLEISDSGRLTRLVNPGGVPAFSNAVGAGVSTDSGVAASPITIPASSSGRANLLAASGASVTINNPFVTAASHVLAQVSQAAADATALRVERVVTGAGTIQVFFTAAATANTRFDWAVVGP